ncbi:MAG: ABC transporter permease [Planctomycetota bacterium]|nr:ABC transporter permease [Planctomycetota bacterium]
MDWLGEGFKRAIDLIVSGDAETWHAVWVTLVCSLSATVLAVLTAAPYGAWLALRKPRGHKLQAFLLRIGMFVPTIFIGVLVYGFVSRHGPLGSLDLYATRTAIVIGEFLLAFPILGTFAYGALAKYDPRALETARTLGAGRARTFFTLLGEVRMVLLSAWLVALARCFSELGISVTVGGNVRWDTRTLSSHAMLEVRQGDFGMALALGLILCLLAIPVAIVAHYVSQEEKE